jgi:hypothetical protein
MVLKLLCKIPKQNPFLIEVGIQVYRVFDSVAAVIFQSVCYLEIYLNNIFLIFKKLFLTLILQNDQ